jgi:hypothetical protein
VTFPFIRIITWIGKSLHLPPFYLSPLMLILKPKFWTQGPNSWDPICQVRPLTPKPPIKRPGEGGRERRFVTRLGTFVGRGRRSTQPVFSHLWGTLWATGLSRQRTGDRGTKVCTVKQSSHRCGLAGLLTDGARNLGHTGGLVQFWKLSPVRNNRVPVWKIWGIIVLSGRVAAPGGSSSLS